MIKEFLLHWRASPPTELRYRKRTGDVRLKIDIYRKSRKMFDEAISFGEPEAKIIYRAITIEDLKDNDLMDKLRDTMKKAGVDKKTVQKLFEENKAIITQDATQ